MFIDKYTVQIKDTYGKKLKKLNIEANTAVEAHKEALSHCNELNQDIIKITNAEKNVVYTLEDGFINE